jgi:hypothetical protein
MISKGFWHGGSSGQPLPGPAVTQNDIEAMFGGDATA